jgi:hypothetical protein
MVKDQLQQELEEKVIPGVKPSDLRKLKRSKSAGDVSSAPPSPPKQITQLKEQVKFHAETAANYLKSLQTSQAKVSELEAQLKRNPPLISTEPTLTHQLDNALQARHKNLKD